MKQQAAQLWTREAEERRQRELELHQRLDCHCTAWLLFYNDVCVGFYVQNRGSNTVQ